MMEQIGFNKPYLTGNELEFISDAVENKQISGNGKYTRLCHEFFENKYQFKKCLLTTSCTDALEMAAILSGVQEGDEVIVPSFTFVSTANAFILRGAKVVFCDSNDKNPNIDPENIEQLITPKTKAIVVVHYAGIACDMERIMSIADKYGLLVIEDAAQAIDSYYQDCPLGSIGHLSAFSFHETKNISAGEGGMLVVNDSSLADRAEIIWEKGTNRSAFFKGKVDKYSWVDIGSSFLPSEIIAAFLYAQLLSLDNIQERRKQIFKHYHGLLLPLQENAIIQLPKLPSYATNNAHMFFLICSSQDERDGLIKSLKKNNITAVFHYLPLHKSPYFAHLYQGKELSYANYYSEHIIRLPLFYELTKHQQKYIVSSIAAYFDKN